MGVTYSVDITNCQEVAGQMRAIAGYIQEMLDDLNTTLMRSLADWSSVSRDIGYAPAQNNWNMAVTDMISQANTAYNSLSQIMDAYANAEYQGLGLWGTRG
jgi:uncharacterized protein YukE